MQNGIYTESTDGQAQSAQQVQQVQPVQVAKKEETSLFVWFIALIAVCGFGFLTYKIGTRNSTRPHSRY
jgi:hypothetical protein